MNKIIAIVFLMLFNTSFAATAGNPLNPEIIEDGFFMKPTSWIDFRLGYEGIFVIDGNLKQKDSKEKIDVFKNDINSGSFTFNLQNRADFFGVLGACKIKTSWRYEQNGIKNKVEFDSNSRLYWAVGGKIILFQWNNAVLSMGGRYSETKLSIEYITLNGSPQDDENSKIKYLDWQLDMGIAYKVDIFIPYIGAKYLNVDSSIKNSPVVITNDGGYIMKMKNKEKYGAYVGCSMSSSKYFMLTLEARFFDEQAISVIGEIRF